MMCLLFYDNDSKYTDNNLNAVSLSLGEQADKRSQISFCIRTWEVFSSVRTLYFKYGYRLFILILYRLFIL